MIVLIVTFLAFILEFVFNIYFYDSIFLPLIILTSLILVEPFFKGNSNRYYIYCFLVGFLYDFVYTGNYFMDAGLFLLVGIMACIISFYMPNNFLVFMLKLFFLIIIYRLCSFIFFSLNGIVDFSFGVLFKCLYSSLILNVVYGIILYFILYFISKKFNVKRIN